MASELGDISDSPSYSVDVAIDERASFVDVVESQTGVSIPNQLIRFFRLEHFDISVFCEKLRNVSDCRKLSALKFQSLFQNSEFQETDITTTWSEGFI